MRIPLGKVLLVLNLVVLQQYGATASNANWMARLPNHLTTIPLNYLAIPGSHDSFSYTIHGNSGVSPDSPEFLKRFGNLKIATNVVAKFALTQVRTFTEQLQAGIRYLDLRICYRKDTPNDPFWFCHGLYAMPVIEHLKHIKEFLDANPKEVVILDFQHFNGFENIRDKIQLGMQIQLLFGNKLVPRTNSIQSITLQSLWQKNQQVWVFYDSSTFDHFNMWSNNMINSPWPNTPKGDTMINFLEERYRNGYDSSKLYVYQGILTVDGGHVFMNLVQGLRKFVRDGNPKFVNWLSNKALAKPKQNPAIGINICIMDFIEEHDFVNKVLKLNK